MNRASKAPDSPPQGFQTMSPAMGQMRRYQRYLFSQAAPYLGRRVLEIGVGHGVYTGWLLERSEVLAADIDEECLDQVRRQYAGSQRLQTARIDLGDAASVAACGGFRPDSILCINVLEHIERDVEALRSLRRILAPDGRLALIVPAHPSLYGRMDQEAGHFRRYTCPSLRRALTEAGWRAERVRYLNAPAAVGWWLNNRLRRKAGLADPAVNAQMRLSDAWLPWAARLSDPWLGRLCGLSVFAVATPSPGE